MILLYEVNTYLDELLVEQSHSGRHLNSPTLLPMSARIRLRTRHR